MLFDKQKSLTTPLFLKHCELFCKAIFDEEFKQDDLVKSPKSVTPAKAGVQNPLK